MSSRPLVIIHGWSDNARSFMRLARLLRDRLKITPKIINLANYVTMDDQVTYPDLVTAMTRAWQREGLPTQPGSVDVVLHSTGSLVVRNWLVDNYTPTTAPIKNMVMLAPANFGSSLAHKGRAFYGRIVKGFNSRKLFQVGAKLLLGLELASPYAWDLAFKDRFGSKVFYGPGKILCTVLIGNSGLHGISAAINEPGSDGVVRISAANLNCAYLDADFHNNPLQPTYTLKQSNGQTAFGIMDGENHYTIAAKDKGPKNAATLDNIITGLTVNDSQFSKWCRELSDMNKIVDQQNINNDYKHSFQNSIVFVDDQYGFHVHDYFLEFYAENDHHTWFTELFHTHVIKSTHAYQADKSYRDLYMNCTKLYSALNNDVEQIHISLTAMPQYLRGTSLVGYRTFTDKDIGAIQVERNQIKKVFAGNRTLLTKLTLRREQADSVFEFEKLPR